MISKMIKNIIEGQETLAICETCLKEFLRINTARYLRESRIINMNLPDKWIVLALEHFYNNPDHELGCYQGGMRNMAPNYELQEQLAKTNPKEIEMFKTKVEMLPF